MSESSIAQGERYAYSRITESWYRVTAWKDLGDGKIQAQSKEEVPREEVPKEYLDATEERGYDE